MVTIRKDMGVKEYEIPLGVQQIELTWEEIYPSLTEEEKCIIAASFLKDGNYAERLGMVALKMSELQSTPLVMDEVEPAML